MKKTIAFFIIILGLLGGLNAQNFPYGINFQAIARDANGNAKTNQPVNIRFSINKTTATGSLIWQEINATAVTNNFGQFNLVIGSGTTTGGGSASSYNAIDWKADVHWLTVDVFNGSIYVPISSQQFQAVPYALAVPDEQFAVYEERYAFNAAVSAIPINVWTGNSSQNYIQLTEQTPSNTSNIVYTAGLITLSPGTYLVRASTNNEVDLSPNGALTMKSRIINSSSIMIAEGSTDYWYYGPGATGDAGKTLTSTIDQVVTVTGTSTTIKFQRYVARGGTGTYLSSGIDGFKIPNEAVVLSRLYIKKIK